MNFWQFILKFAQHQTSMVRMSGYSWFLVFISFLVITTEGTCAIDTTHNPISVSASGHYGFIIAHSKKMRDISHHDPWGIELDVSWLSKTRRAWQRLDGYSRSGVAFYYFNYANPEVLGSSYNLIAYFEPFLNYNRELYASVRFGIGVSYLTDIYHPDKNSKNIVFSTRISYLPVVNVNLQYRLNKKNEVVAGFSYNHISNGGVKQPNLGLNFPTYKIGYRHYFRVVDYIDLNSYYPDIKPKKKWIYNLELMGTIKTIEKNDTDQNDLMYENTEHEATFTYGLTAYVNRTVYKRHALCGGIEFIRDGYLKRKIKKEGSDIDHHQVGLLLGNQVYIGKFSFSIKFGYYVYAPYETLRPVYQRYSLLYKINDRHYAGVSIKAHGHVADVFDVRLGIRL